MTRPINVASRTRRVQKKSLALVYDLDEQKYWAGEMDDETQEYLPSAELPIGEVVLPEGLRILDVETTLEGRVESEVAMTRFNGPVEGVV